MTSIGGLKLIDLFKSEISNNDACKDNSGRGNPHLGYGGCQFGAFPWGVAKLVPWVPIGKHGL